MPLLKRMMLHKSAVALVAMVALVSMITGGLFIGKFFNKGNGDNPEEWELNAAASSYNSKVEASMLTGATSIVNATSYTSGSVTLSAGYLYWCVAVGGKGNLGGGSSATISNPGYVSGWISTLSADGFGAKSVSYYVGGGGSAGASGGTSNASSTPGVAAGGSGGSSGIQSGGSGGNGTTNGVSGYWAKGGGGGGGGGASGLVTGSENLLRAYGTAGSAGTTYTNTRTTSGSKYVSATSTTYTGSGGSAGGSSGSNNVSSSMYSMTGQTSSNTTTSRTNGTAGYVTITRYTLTDKLKTLVDEAAVVSATDYSTTTYNDMYNKYVTANNLIATYGQFRYPGAEVVNKSDYSWSTSTSTTSGHLAYKALREAIDNLRGDVTQLKELYNHVIETYIHLDDGVQLKLFYSNWNAVQTALGSALGTSGTTSAAYILRMAGHLEYNATTGVANVPPSTPPTGTANKFTNTQVNNSYTALNNAVNNLAISKTELQALITEADALQSVQFEVASWAQMSVALSNAKTINQTATPTVTQVIQAGKNLRNGIDSLRLSWTNLTVAISVAEANFYIENDPPVIANVWQTNGLLRYFTSSTRNIFMTRLQSAIDMRYKLETQAVTWKDPLSPTYTQYINCINELNTALNAMAFDLSGINARYITASNKIDRHYTGNYTSPSDPSQAITPNMNEKDWEENGWSDQAPWYGGQEGTWSMTDQNGQQVYFTTGRARDTWNALRLLLQEVRPLFMGSSVSPTEFGTGAALIDKFDQLIDGIFDDLVLSTLRLVDKIYEAEIVLSETEITEDKATVQAAINYAKSLILALKNENKGNHERFAVYVPCTHMVNEPCTDLVNVGTVIPAHWRGAWTENGLAFTEGGIECAENAVLENDAVPVYVEEFEWIPEYTDMNQVNMQPEHPEGHQVAQHPEGDFDHYQNSSVTGFLIDAAIEMINQSYKNLTINKKLLQELIDQANTLHANASNAGKGNGFTGGYYTQQSLDNLQNAINAGVAHLQPTSVDVLLIIADINNLRAAMVDLRFDTTVIVNYINRYTGTYTPAGPSSQGSLIFPYTGIVGNVAALFTSQTRTNYSTVVTSAQAIQSQLGTMYPSGVAPTYLYTGMPIQYNAGAKTFSVHWWNGSAYVVQDKTVAEIIAANTTNYRVENPDYVSATATPNIAKYINPSKYEIFAKAVSEANTQLLNLITSFEDAWNALVPDKSGLLQLITDANTIQNSATYQIGSQVTPYLVYESAGWNVFRNEVLRAQRIYDNQDPDTGIALPSGTIHPLMTVLNQVTSLTQKMNQMSLNPQALAALVAQSNQIIGNYDGTNWDVNNPYNKVTVDALLNERNKANNIYLPQLNTQSGLTKNQYIEAVNELASKINALTINDSSLRTLIAEAETLFAYSTRFSVQSYNNLVTRITQIKNTIGPDNAPINLGDTHAEQMATMFSNLQAVIRALVIEDTTLQAAILACADNEKYENFVTVASFKQFKDALADAKVTVQNMTAVPPVDAFDAVHFYQNIMSQIDLLSYALINAPDMFLPDNNYLAGFVADLCVEFGITTQNIPQTHPWFTNETWGGLGAFAPRLSNAANAAALNQSYSTLYDAWKGLNDAYNALVPEKSGLQMRILQERSVVNTYIAGMNANKYPTNAFAVYTNVIDAAQVVYDNPNAKYKDIFLEDGAITKLDNARRALELARLGALIKAVDSRRTVANQNGDDWDLTQYYTIDSWQAVLAALALAEIAYNNGDGVSTDDLNSIVAKSTALENAILNIQYDASSLAGLLQTAKNLQAVGLLGYMPEGLAVLDTAIENGDNIIALDNPTPEQITAACKQLVNAIVGLVGVGDLTDILNSMLENIVNGHYNENDYTHAAWQTFMNVITGLHGNTYQTVEQVQLATGQLNAAIQALLPFSIVELRDAVTTATMVLADEVNYSQLSFSQFVATLNQSEIDILYDHGSVANIAARVQLIADKKSALVNVAQLKTVIKTMTNITDESHFEILTMFEAVAKPNYMDIDKYTDLGWMAITTKLKSIISPSNLLYDGTQENVDLMTTQLLAIRDVNTQLPALRAILQRLTNGNYRNNNQNAYLLLAYNVNNYVTHSWSILQDTLFTVFTNSVVYKATTTEQEILDTIAALTDAENGLIDFKTLLDLYTTNLTNYIAPSKRGNFTDATWDALKDTLDTFEDDHQRLKQEGEQEEVTFHINAITTAVNNLISVIYNDKNLKDMLFNLSYNFGNEQKLYSDIIAIDNMRPDSSEEHAPKYYFTVKSYTAFKVAYLNAVPASQTGSYVNVISAISNLSYNMDALVMYIAAEMPDLIALYELHEKWHKPNANYRTDPEDPTIKTGLYYTETTFNTLFAALTKAKQVIDSNTLDRITIMDAFDTLTDAVYDLIVDKTELTVLYNTKVDWERKYLIVNSNDDWTTFKSDLERAQSAIQNPYISLDDYSTVLGMLQMSSAFQFNTPDIGELINLAAGFRRNQFLATDEQWTAMNNAKDNAIAMVHAINTDDMIVIGGVQSKVTYIYFKNTWDTLWNSIDIMVLDTTELQMLIKAVTTNAGTPKYTAINFTGGVDDYNYYVSKLNAAKSAVDPQRPTKLSLADYNTAWKDLIDALDRISANSVAPHSKEQLQALVDEYGAYMAKYYNDETFDMLKRMLFYAQTVLDDEDSVHMKKNPLTHVQWHTENGTTHPLTHQEYHDERGDEHDDDTCEWVEVICQYQEYVVDYLGASPMEIETAYNMLLNARNALVGGLGFSYEFNELDPAMYVFDLYQDYSEKHADTVEYINSKQYNINDYQDIIASIEASRFACILTWAYVEKMGWIDVMVDVPVMEMVHQKEWKQKTEMVQKHEMQTHWDDEAQDDITEWLPVWLMEYVDNGQWVVIATQEPCEEEGDHEDDPLCEWIENWEWDFALDEEGEKIPVMDVEYLFEQEYVDNGTYVDEGGWVNIDTGEPCEEDHDHQTADECYWLPEMVWHENWEWTEKLDEEGNPVPDMEQVLMYDTEKVEVTEGKEVTVQETDGEGNLVWKTVEQDTGNGTWIVIETGELCEEPGEHEEHGTCEYVPDNQLYYVLIDDTTVLVDEYDENTDPARVPVNTTTTIQVPVYEDVEHIVKDELTGYWYIEKVSEIKYTIVQTPVMAEEQTGTTQVPDKIWGGTGEWGFEFVGGANWNHWDYVVKNGKGEYELDIESYKMTAVYAAKVIAYDAIFQWGTYVNPDPVIQEDVRELLDALIAAFNDPNSTDVDVEEAMVAFYKLFLELKLDEARTKVINMGGEEKITPRSYALYTAAEEQAVIALANLGITADQISRVTKELDQAMNGLTLRANKDAIIESVDVAKARIDEYGRKRITPESLAALNKAIDEALILIGDEDASQKDVDEANLRLRDAIENIILLPEPKRFPVEYVIAAGAILLLIILILVLRHIAKARRMKRIESYKRAKNDARQAIGAAATKVVEANQENRVYKANKADETQKNRVIQKVGEAGEALDEAAVKVKQTSLAKKRVGKVKKEELEGKKKDKADKKKEEKE